MGQPFQAHKSAAMRNMKLTIGILLVFVAATPILAQQKPLEGCKVSFALVYVDRLDNINRGVEGKHLKAVQDKLRKYGDVCYTANEATADYVFFVHTKPAVYHGVRTTSDTSTHTDTSPVNGTITDQNGDMSTVNGTIDATTTTTTTSSVPYEMDYSVFILNILVPETKPGAADKNYRVLRTFDQKGLYHTIYGIGYGKGKHPIPTLIDEAANWLHENNLGK